MLGYRFWEISRGRHNADRNRRAQRMPLEVFFTHLLPALKRFKPYVAVVQNRTREAAASIRRKFSNSRGFIGFQNLIHGKYHMSQSRRPSPFLQDVAEHKGALPRERSIEEE